MRSTRTEDVVSVIDRVALVLASFHPDDRRLGVSELSRRANLPKSTVSRLVTELVSHRYLERDGSGVRLGLRLFELGELATEPNALRAVAVEAMADLRDAVDETVQLTVLDGTDVLCLGVLHARGASQALMEMGTRAPARSSAAGRVLLAFATSSRRPGETSALARDLASDLASDLAEIRETGLAVDRDPRSGRVVGVAGAILARGFTPVAAITVSGLPATFDPARVAPAVRAAALALGRRAATAQLAEPFEQAVAASSVRPSLRARSA